MLKTKKIIIFFGVIIILLVLAFMLIIFQNENTDRVKNMYDNISNHQDFTFSMEEQNLGFYYKIAIAQRGTDTSINMYIGDEYTTTLTVDEYAYYIMHDEKEYSVTDSSAIEGDIIISGLKEIIDSPYETGKEEINGKEYYYEEYTNASAFCLFIDAYDENSIKTRFYFDGDNIVYIKNISTEEDVEDELLKIKLEYSVQNELFEIPDDYAEISISY